MFMDKCVLDESHPNFIGMYDGKLMNEQVRSFVEGCDCVLGIGAMMTDFNSGAFIAKIDRSKSINIMQNHARVGNAIYPNVGMKDLLIELSKRLPRKDVSAPHAHGLGAPVGQPNEKITVDYLYPRWEKMLRPNDIVVAETGTTSMGLGFAKMPKGSTFQNQTLWGSIGWATPAAFEALGCDGWFTARATTCGELDQAIEKAEHAGTGAYIEVVTDKYAASPLAQKIHDARDTLYAA